jgi:hypothetical protein
MEPGGIFDRWWTVTSANNGDLGAPGNGWKLTRTEFQLAGKGRVERRRSAATRIGNVVRLTRGPFSLTFRVVNNNLEAEAHGGAYDARGGAKMTARPSSDSEAKEFALAIAAHPDIDEACAAAKRCFEASCAPLGNKACDFSKETSGTSLHECEATAEGVRELLMRMQKPVPAACAEGEKD